MNPRRHALWVWLLVLMFVGLVHVSAMAQEAGQAPAGDQGAAPQPPTFKPEEIEALLAPIALYPDNLLAQVFMASTYPLEVVEAARWVKENPKVTGKALEDAMPDADSAREGRGRMAVRYDRWRG